MSEVVRRYPDREEPQNSGHRSPVRGGGFGTPIGRSRADGRVGLYRHAQRERRLLSGASLRAIRPPPRRMRVVNRAQVVARSRRVSPMTSKIAAR